MPYGIRLMSPLVTYFSLMVKIDIIDLFPELDDLEIVLMIDPSDQSILQGKIRNVTLNRLVLV